MTIKPLVVIINAIKVEQLSSLLVKRIAVMKHSDENPEKFLSYELSSYICSMILECGRAQNQSYSKL